LKIYFDLIIIGIAVQVAPNMPNTVADVPEKFDAKFVTPNQHVYTGEYHSVMPEPGVPMMPLAPQFFHLPTPLPYGRQINNMKLSYTKSVSLKLTQN
jgi:hypothetical protein